MHKLLKSEIKNLDNYWKFIETFYVDETKDWIHGVYGYRHDLIKKIREKYTTEDFYKYEKILNKLLWNLIEHIKFNIDTIEITLKEKLYDKIKYKHNRSFSHKQYLYNQKINKKYYFKHYKEISDYPIINAIFYIVSKKELYNEVMSNKIYNINNKILHDKIYFAEDYYYPADYAFPNINLLFYNENKKDLWIKRINTLYFNKNDKINEGWYSFDENSI
jgi:hypothetical protein